MSKQPLAFTLRPKTLEDVIGQKHLVGPNCLLTRMVKSGKPINIIFYGYPGIGKTTLATALCNDMKLPYAMFNAATDKKVIIFEEIQQLVSQNDKTNPINALLKLMENPNSKTYFIFTSMAALPKSGFTSRCMQFTFPEPSHTDILKYLYNASKKIEYEGVPVLQYLLNEPKAGEKFCKEGFLEIAKASDYSYRNALMALQECVMTKMFDIDSIAIRFGGINDENVIRLIKDIARNDKSEHVLKVMSLVDNTNYMKLYYIGSMIIREAESYKLFNKVMKKKTVKDEEGNPKEVYETLTDGAFEVTQARELSESPNFERLKKAIESFAFCNLPSKDLLMTKLLSCYS